MKRREFMSRALVATSGLVLYPSLVSAETFLTVDQARRVLWGSDHSFEAMEIELTKAQMKSIARSAQVRVRRETIKAWKSKNNDWFILDQVIGKHEFIDLAVAITNEGRVKGLEVLTYRESYGEEIRNDRWRAQFHGKDSKVRLVLDKQIKNIGGATLSCRHVTDGINRLLHTWDQVLRHL